ncbi:hypothetical protein CROQUDRAFT_238715 [Cronartium quercuum f. sp. fusiforme G11]|uniref:Uncharacterized protein n=1 Tax=Cronartium quercuum f. sp. fusiforme G11 TaxID=708437 RepID=A0A9P6NAH0_9BASI|nr:hypothetical protein CROQUDRAFT_238715 [Cronartium quercuum f. sp. fusiforme G11]
MTRDLPSSNINSSGPNGNAVVFSDILTAEEIGQCNSRAQIDGTIAGLASGSSGALLTSRFRILSPNGSALLGFGVGILVGYYYSKTALSSNLKQCEQNKRALQHAASAKVTASTTESEIMRDPYAK